MLHIRSIYIILGEIFITLDSHHKKHIAHKAFWSDIRNDTENKGNMPQNFDTISYENLKASHENHKAAPKEGKKGQTRWYPRDASLEVMYVHHYMLYM